MSKVLYGKVTSNRMNKTIVVQIVRQVPHPRYKKIVRRFTKIFANDAENVCNIGDYVKIAEGRKMSKNKSWILLEVVRKAD